MEFKIFNYLSKDSPDLAGVKIINVDITESEITFRLSDDILKKILDETELVSPSLTLKLDEIEEYKLIDIYCEFPNLSKFCYDSTNDLIKHIKAMKYSLPKFRIFRDKSSYFIINNHKYAVSGRYQISSRYHLEASSSVHTVNTFTHTDNDNINILMANSSDENAIEALKLNVQKINIGDRYINELVNILASDFIDTYDPIRVYLIKSVLESNPSLKNEMESSFGDSMSILENSDPITLKDLKRILSNIEKRKELESNYNLAIEKINSRLSELRDD